MSTLSYQPKDFIATAQGLLFAVVAAGAEQGKIRGFLRYVRQDGRWQKVHSMEANQYLADYYPEFLFHSPQMDALVHGVAVPAISQHYQPRPRLQQYLQAPPTDGVLADLQQLCAQLQAVGFAVDALGITGSTLIGLQNPQSDIDLVCYDRQTFQQLRLCVKQLLEQGSCQDLGLTEWQQAWQRRGCDLSLEEYIVHEQRKYNHALINQRKFDISLVADAADETRHHYRKLGAISLTCTVTDDYHAFDYPALLRVDHPDIKSVVSFTATYSGQAQTGERISVSGQLEVNEQGEQRIVVGSSREAQGEYIRCL